MPLLAPAEALAQPLASAVTATGYGAYLFQTALVLGTLCAVGLLLVRVRGRRDEGVRGLRVVAQLALEPRRSIYVVEAGGRHLLVGVSDGPMALLTELSPGEARTIEEAAQIDSPLGQLARRLLRGAAK